MTTVYAVIVPKIVQTVNEGGMMAARRIRSSFFDMERVEAAIQEVEDWARANREAAAALNKIWRANCKHAGHKTMGRAIYHLDSRPGILEGGE